MSKKHIDTIYILELQNVAMSLLTKIRKAVGEAIMPDNEPLKVKNYGSMAAFASQNWMEYLGTQLSALWDVVITPQTFYTIHKSNLIVRRYYRKVVKMVAKYWFSITTLKDWKQTPIDNPEKYMEKINYFFSIPTFDLLKQKVFTHAFCSWQIFGIVGETNLTWEKMKLKVLDTRAININTDWYGSPTSYQYVTWDNETFLPDNIVDSLVLYDQDVEYQGISMYQGMVLDALSDVEMQNTTYYYFRNKARPDTVFMLSEDLLNNKDELNEFRNQIKEKFSGSKSTGKPLVSAGIKDVKTLEIWATDISRIESRSFNDTRVAICFGIDKRLVGYDKEVGWSRAEIDSVSQINSNNQIREYATILEDFMTTCVKKFLFKEWDSLNLQISTINDEFTNPVKDRELFLEEVKNGVSSRAEYREEFDRTTDELPEEMYRYTIPKWTTFIDSKPSAADNTNTNADSNSSDNTNDT